MAAVCSAAVVAEAELEVEENGENKVKDKVKSKELAVAEKGVTEDGGDEVKELAVIEKDVAECEGCEVKDKVGAKRIAVAEVRDRVETKELAVIEDDIVEGGRNEVKDKVETKKLAVEPKELAVAEEDAAENEGNEVTLDEIEAAIDHPKKAKNQDQTEPRQNYSKPWKDTMLHIKQLIDHCWIRETMPTEATLARVAHI